MLALVLARSASAGDEKPATSDDARQRALARLEEGRRLFDRADYEAALTAFQQAYEIYPSAKIHFNLGLTHERLGRRARALDHFQRFLVEAADAAAEPRSQAQALAANLRPKVASVEITADVTGAQVEVDGEPRGRTPLPQAIFLEPGAHLLVVRGPQEQPAHSEALRLRAGESVRVPVRFRVPMVDPPPPSPAAPARPLYSRWWFWTAVGAVAAGSAAALAIPREGSLRQGTLGSADTRR